MLDSKSDTSHTTDDEELLNETDPSYVDQDDLNIPSDSDFSYDSNESYNSNKVSRTRAKSTNPSKKNSIQTSSSSTSSCSQPKAKRRAVSGQFHIDHNDENSLNDPVTGNMDLFVFFSPDNF